MLKKIKSKRPKVAAGDDKFLAQDASKEDMKKGIILKLQPFPLMK
ncbi:MAG: hypothetical protein SCK28_09115 [Bacillota bacterium]|nr:hypothetical protein [Bacillota bacterium]